MLLFTGKCVNSGILNIGVAQDIGQMHDILLHPVISNREQMAQIMRKNFFRADPGLFAQCLHFCPYITTVNRCTIFGDKNRSGVDSILSAVLEQAFFQLLWQKDYALLAFVLNSDYSSLQRLPSDKTVLADTDTGTAYCLDHKKQAAA